MITILLIGVISSALAELVTALNKRLAGTVLKGEGSFLVALLVALIAASVKVFYVDGTPLPALTDLKTWDAVAPVFTQVWAVSQIFFIFVIQKFNLDVKPDPVPPTV